MRITRKELTEMVEDEVANALLDISVKNLREGYVKTTVVDVDALVEDLMDYGDPERDYDELAARFRSILARHGIVDG
jgi:hypothetical protein